MSSSIETLVNREYKFGFVTDIEADTIPHGLNEETVRLEDLIGLPTKENRRRTPRGRGNRRFPQDPNSPDGESRWHSSGDPCSCKSADLGRADWKFRPLASAAWG